MKSLIDAIKEATLAPRNDGMLHFSSHLNHNRHTCLYYWFGYPAYQDTPWANTLPLLQGTSIHEQVHKIMEDYHKPYASEIEIVADDGFDYPWVGTADAYTEDENSDVWLVDYKTISGASYTFLEGPKPEHIMQVSAYYHYGMPTKRVGILYLPTSSDYKRRWHEPEFFEVTPWPREKLREHMLGVETDISIYLSTQQLPPPPKGEYVWKNIKREKHYELTYKPHYASMFCPWKNLIDDPCGCSNEKARIIGRVDYDKEFIDGDEEQVASHIDKIVG
jgi:hypothetical protein